MRIRGAMLIVLVLVATQGLSVASAEPDAPMPPTSPTTLSDLNQGLTEERRLLSWWHVDARVASV